MTRDNAHWYLWQDLTLEQVLSEREKVYAWALTHLKPWLYHEIDDTLYYLKLRALELELGVKVDETLCCEEPGRERGPVMDEGHSQGVAQGPRED